MTDAATERLFSYGTLQLDHVQHALFGRTLAGEPDTLSGFFVTTIETRDPAAVAASGIETHLALIAGDGPAIVGMLYCLTPDEMVAADDYEGADYIRVAVTFGSGETGWVYLAATTSAS